MPCSIQARDTRNPDTATALQDNQTTPAPSQRQLRQTRSQTRHSDVGSVDQPHAKANQAVEVSHDYGDEDVDILALSSPSSAGEVDITGSPAVAMTAALHAALHPDELLQEVSCCLLYCTKQRVWC